VVPLRDVRPRAWNTGTGVARRRRASGRRYLATVIALLGVGMLLSFPRPTPSISVGVAADEIETFDAFAATTRTSPRLFIWYQSWAYEPVFDVALARAALDRGALPVVTWEPWNPDAGLDQPEYSLSSIASGQHDVYIAQFAGQVRDAGFDVGLRFMHELNAPYYPWGASVNGNSADEAVAAWRHVRQIFAAVGATNVTWIWCVNIHDNGTVPYGPLYPGDDVVDWVGVDGYNAGDAQPWGGWRTPSELFARPVADLRALSHQPIAIMETGSSESGGDKATWIFELFDFVRQQRLQAVVWFEYDKEADWRVRSSESAVQAFRTQASAVEPGRRDDSQRHRE
jgi:hypothetical protein